MMLVAMRSMIMPVRMGRVGMMHIVHSIRMIRVSAMCIGMVIMRSIILSGAMSIGIGSGIGSRCRLAIHSIRLVHDIRNHLICLCHNGIEVLCGDLLGPSSRCPLIRCVRGYRMWWMRLSTISAVGDNLMRGRGLFGSGRGTSSVLPIKVISPGGLVFSEYIFEPAPVLFVRWIFLEFQLLSVMEVSSKLIGISCTEFVESRFLLPVGLSENPKPCQSNSVRRIEILRL